ncbi:MAG: CPBP family intramembrane metalloprotease [Gemmatimonadota bacterium]|nr:CPBP family intramembrane metalloprotease [Gemmatimonadota bacterium]
MRVAEIFRLPSGRLRLGWRLALFLLAAALLTFVALLVLPGGLTGSSVATTMGCLGAGWMLLRLEGRPFADLGLRPGVPALAGSGAGVGVGVAVGLAAVLLMAILGGVTWSRTPGTAQAWALSGGATLGILALPALAEEALLRGYPLLTLSEEWGGGPAVVVTAVVFGLLHLGNPEVTALAIGNIVAAGLLLGAVYVRTGSLWWAFGVHLGWNWAHAFLVDLPVSGFDLVDTPLIEAAPRGAQWIGGGAFGPEGSVAATVALLCAAAVVWRVRIDEPMGDAGPGGEGVPVELAERVE